jgi:membrane protein YdbS with pleckstrin-like domain
MNAAVRSYLGILILALVFAIFLVEVVFRLKAWFFELVADALLFFREWLSSKIP